MFGLYHSAGEQGTIDTTEAGAAVLTDRAIALGQAENPVGRADVTYETGVFGAPLVNTSISITVAGKAMITQELAVSLLYAPSLRRRLYSMAYEAMLLFGVLFAAGWLFSTVLQQRHALYLRATLQDWLFFVLGAYFVWFWVHGGQTLAMKTWRIRLVNADGTPVKPLRAVARYMLAWCWLLPGLALAWAMGAQRWLLLLIPMANVIGWAMTVYLDPQRQFLHDRMLGTRLVDIEKSAQPT